MISANLLSNALVPHLALHYRLFFNTIAAEGLRSGLNRYHTSSYQNSIHNIFNRKFHPTLDLTKLYFHCSLVVNRPEYFSTYSKACDLFPNFLLFYQAMLQDFDS
jgi:hypothetical protein